jgi:MinD superfamily P-loop ATPase
VTQVVVVAAGEGAVGTTTTAIDVAALLAETGRRVLLVDCDPHDAGRADLVRLHRVRLARCVPLVVYLEPAAGGSRASGTRSAPPTGRR